MQIPTIVKSPSFKTLRIGQRSVTPKQKTIHCGWLWKRGVLNSQLTNRRWFEIKGDQMYYFRSQGDEYPLGQVPLAGNEIFKHGSLADSSGKFVFELIAGEERKGRPVAEHSESLLFATQSLIEMEDWIRAINRVIYTPLGGGMFGRSLNETIKIETRKGSDGIVPLVVEKCASYLKVHGVRQEGLFRVPGNQSEVEDLKNRFNKGEDINMEELKPPVNIAASLLKQYIAELPEPVIPKESYEQFVAISGLYETDPEAVIEKFKYLLERIPETHYNLLEYICKFLHDIQGAEERTKMNLANLSTVFGPIMLRPQDDDPTFLLKSLGAVNTTLKLMIENERKIFTSHSDEERIQKMADTISSEFTNTICFRNPLSNIDFTIWSDKRSLSESNLSKLKKDIPKLHPAIEGKNFEEKVMKLQDKIDVMRKQHFDQVEELRKKLKAEVKIREMLQIRLQDEQTARKNAEERIEVYKTAIEDYCSKFGSMDLKI